MRFIPVIFGSIALSGCVTVENVSRINDPGAIKNAREEVATRLKDAPSARWQGEVVYEATERQGQTSIMGIAVCGQVNSRNSFGGYPGFTTYYVGQAPGRSAVVYIGELALYKCQQFSDGV